MLNGCREKWLFKPKSAPEKQPSMPEVASIGDLGILAHFTYEPQKASPYTFEMQDGIIKIFSDDTKSDDPFPLPGTSVDFFTDMHRCRSPSSCTVCHAKEVEDSSQSCMEL